LIDSAVYGLIFTDSYGRVAEMFPVKGYAGFMQGYVVDMLWFPILRGEFPKWLPLWGGEPFEFFRPVFNIADAAITVSVFFVLIFQKRFFPQEETTNTSTSNEQPSKETTTDAVQPTPEA
nr:signal peptidase II [Chitinophagales bacterium]